MSHKTEEIEKVVKDFTEVKSQVLFLLENYPDTRNWDFYLLLLWLKIFGKIEIEFVDWEKIKKLASKPQSILRMRRKIQNEEGLFPPTDPKIKKLRMNRSKLYRRIF